MSLLESITKPGWEHSKPEARKAAIDELDDPSVLLALVDQDPDEGVRAHALARITDSVQLDDLCISLTGALQQQARAQRLEQLLPDSSQISSISDDGLLVRIASLTDDPELISRAISQVQSADVRMDVAANHSVARVRLCAAQGIADISQLRELMNEAKHKDKSVFRYCKDLVDEHHAAERAEAERQARIQQLTEDASKLAKGVDSPEYKSRWQTLRARWSELEGHANEAQRDKIQTDLDIAEKRIEKIDQARAAEEEQQALIEGAAQAFEEVITELESIEPANAVMTDTGAVRTFREKLDKSEDRWLAALHHAQPTAGQFKTCKKLLKHWRAVAQSSQQVLDRRAALEALNEDIRRVDKSDFLALQNLEKKTSKLIQKLPWPDSLTSQRPESIQLLHDQLARLQENVAGLRKKEEKNLERLESAFEELRKELDTNHFNNADRALNRLKNVLRQVGPQQQRRFQKELKPLVGRLQEIHDWQGFAIEPKKTELCERMEALVGVDEAPDILAGKIKALQEEWKKLGHLSPRRDRVLWKKFSVAADEAYAPCKDAFSQQAAKRRQNYAQRMELVAQLTDYEKRMAWPDDPDTEPGAAAPDWRIVQKTLDTARETFRNIKPVDRKGERKSHKALNSVCERIFGHVRKEYERNIARKQELVQQAQALAVLEDLRDAISQAKGIQREWKEVGITPRQVDRQLWKDFRGACDAVFARLDAEKAERNAATRERRQAAEMRKRKKQERWPRMLDRIQACALKEKDAEKAVSLWEKEGDIPKGVDMVAMEEYWEQGPAKENPEETLREACIALEVFAGMDSPPEDKEVRMAYQMQRLVEGMGSQQVGGTQRLMELINEFIAKRPPEVWMERFGAGVEAALKNLKFIQ